MCRSFIVTQAVRQSARGGKNLRRQLMSDKSDLVIFQKTHRGRGRDKKGKIWHGGVKWQKDKSVMNKDTGYPLISGGNGCKDGKMGKRDRFLLTKDEWIEEEEQEKIDKLHQSFKTQTRREWKKWIDKEMMAEGEVDAVSIRKTYYLVLFLFSSLFCKRVTLGKYGKQSMNTRERWLEGKMRTGTTRWHTWLNTHI